MRKVISLLFLCVSVWSYAQEPTLATRESVPATREPAPETFLLTGASFAIPQNGWFEIACRSMGITGINRAIGGKAIADTANQMAEGTLYSRDELNQMDALVIMHTHDRDVFDETNLKSNYRDYPLPFDRSNYAAAYDYVIKRYISDCYELKDDSSSVYYGTPQGKFPVIILCTHWHNARTTFNGSVRKLAEKWGLVLVEFDEHIGFNALTRHPVTGASPSLLYAQDTQETNGVKYGWHPMRGENQYIQQKLANIFEAKCRTFFQCNRDIICKP